MFLGLDRVAGSPAGALVGALASAAVLPWRFPTPLRRFETGHKSSSGGILCNLCPLYACQ
jgi:hypothetical protein